LYVRLFFVTSALLFVALIVSVELTYRWWVRRTVSRRTAAVRQSIIELGSRAVDDPARAAAVIPMPLSESPQDSKRPARRSG